MKLLSLRSTSAGLIFFVGAHLLYKEKKRKEKKRKIVNSKPLIKLYVHVLNLFSSKEMINRPGVYITLTDLYDEK
jgi:hypothetical protein